MNKGYDKANSFVDIRKRIADPALIRDRILNVLKPLDLESKSDHRSAILRRVQNDLSAEVTGDDTPRFQLKNHVLEEIHRLDDADLPRYLFYRYRYDLFPVLHELDAYPPCVQIEPSSICNYRCVFCYQTDKALSDKRNGHMGTMPLDLFRKIVDELEGEVEAVTMASRGEPLIARDMHEMLAYLRGKFLGLKINTNAWFLDEKMAHSILQAGVNTLVFSADAAQEPLYSQLRVNGKLDRVLKNIEQFQRIRERDYPGSRMITRVSGVSIDEKQNLDEMESFWGGLVDQVAFVNYIPWVNSYEAPLTGIESPCSDLWRRMFVWCDGRVNPCDVDYLSTLSPGGVTDSSVSAAWTGEGYQDLRKKHLAESRGEIEPCRRCSMV
ncbi:MAG: radical SAM protein [bacterium]|nr:radical SAM protein [bacterium]